MTATPFWFGPAERPLFGWFHAPDGGEARGGVVLCPPLGIEAICVYFTYRALADRLVAAGMAVVRFDYDGTGDSFGGQDDPDRTESWLTSVDAAVAALRATGVASVGLVGIRMGALLAAARSGAVGADALVLWDPCLSGRAFLREQRAFRLLSIGGEDADTGVDAPGMRFSPSTVATLGELDLFRVAALPSDILLLEDAERPRSRKLAQRLGDVGVEWAQAIGQSALLDPPRQQPALATADRVCGWMAKVMDRPATAVRAPLSGSAVVGRSPSGGEVTEHPVVLGPRSLFGMVTEPPEPSLGPTIVFVDEGNTPHIGQSRLWVELGRSWAASGLRVLRFDLSGNGDSPAGPGQDPHMARAPEAFDDVFDATRAISPRDPSDVVLVGLCSGAYQSIEHALVHPTRGVCAINPAFSFLPKPGEPAGLRRPARQRTRAGVVRLISRPLRWAIGRRSPLAARRWQAALEAGWWPASVATRQGSIPQAVWWAANRLLLKHPAALTLEQVVRSGTDLILISSAPDLAPITLGERGTFRRLRRSSGFHLQVVDGLDHAGLRISEREQLKSSVTEQIIGRYGLPPGPRPGEVPLAVTGVPWSAALSV